MQGTWRTRSAKVQVLESDLPSSLPSQTGLAFNVWYNKWSQGNSGQKRFVNPYKLIPEVHSGLTYGDKIGQLYFCLYFSKGMCCLGKKCQYLHHIPEETDISQLSLKSNVLDCFGREKFSDYRDDMGGVGSFTKKNRTLYVGGISGSLNNKDLKPSQIENRIRFMFEKMGEIDRIRYISDKNCAFVKFRYQTNAEFAKESMCNQSLLILSDKEYEQRKEGTGLLVKWANDDPNPESRKREIDEQNLEALDVMVKLVKKFEEAKSSDVKVEDNNMLLNKKRKANSIKSDIFSDSVLEKLKKHKRVEERIEDKSSIQQLVNYSSSCEEDD